MFNIASGGVVFTTIQKFSPAAGGSVYPVLSDRRNIVVIADTDLLLDYMWVETRAMFGQRISQVFANNGDLIANVLDNLGDDVKGWKQTGYRFVKRQSQGDPNTWVSLGKPTHAPAYVSR